MKPLFLLSHYSQPFLRHILLKHLENTLIIRKVRLLDGKYAIGDKNGLRTYSSYTVRCTEWALFNPHIGGFRTVL